MTDELKDGLYWLNEETPLGLCWTLLHKRGDNWFYSSGFRAPEPKDPLKVLSPAELLDLRERLSASEARATGLSGYATHRQNCKAVWSYGRPMKSNGERYPVLQCDCGLAALLASPTSPEPGTTSGEAGA